MAAYDKKAVEKRRKRRRCNFGIQTGSFRHQVNSIGTGSDYSTNFSHSSDNTTSNAISNQDRSNPLSQVGPIMEEVEVNVERNLVPFRGQVVRTESGDEQFYDSIQHSSSALEVPINSSISQEATDRAANERRGEGTAHFSTATSAVILMTRNSVLTG